MGLIVDAYCVMMGVMMSGGCFVVNPNWLHGESMRFFFSCPHDDLMMS
jgi:hypothetical protein